MFRNRKIRKMIKNELEPPISFDEFFEQAGIDFQTVKPTQTKRKWLSPVISTATASAIIVCGCIPLMLPKDSVNAPEMPLYGYNDVVYIPCDISAMQSDDSIVMFDMEKVQQTAGSFSIHPKNDSNKCLGFNMEDVIFGQEINETLYAYEFDYLIRTYKGFEFLEANLYHNLSQHFNFHGVNYRYEINKTDTYITFNISENDYFISLKSYEGLTEINQHSVEMFITIAFG